MKNIHKLSILAVALSFPAHATMPISKPMPIDLEHLLDIQRQAYLLCINKIKKGLKEDKECQIELNTITSTEKRIQQRKNSLRS
ncbi:hypothetical protein MEG05_16085 [Vibrio aestuarianus]|uniref:hypothetical protein n=1 Tax=Vibrio aestuarianus TaxID=28171 RepID=UPI00237C6295|nr:hypothetical protein [Vibrio aestuarianus]MDE1315578.1 hypothetical protein [Vibrio aestuarianus]